MCFPQLLDTLSAISGPVSALATVATAIVAAFALRWARDAASAAQTQVSLLEKQIQFSEPQPVLLLGCNNKTFEIENVGEELAFDAQVSDLIRTGRGTVNEISRVHFYPVPLLREKERLQLPYDILPGPTINASDSFGQPIPTTGPFIQQMINDTLIDARSRGTDTNNRFDLATLTVTYNNARGRSFSTAFVLSVVKQDLVRCDPATSLVKQPNSIRTTPS